MIQQVSAYRVGELVFPTIQDAQKKELEMLLADGGEHTEIAKAVIESIILHTDEVVAILTCQPKSKKPRSDKGKSHRKPVVTPALAP